MKSFLNEEINCKLCGIKGSGIDDISPYLAVQDIVRVRLP
jgi:hypothetical protein